MLSTAVVGVLLILSALLTLRTAFPRVPLEPVATGLGALLALLLLSGGTSLLRNPARRQTGTQDLDTWTMPPIESSAPPVPSRGRTLALVVLRCYLFLAVGLLVARAVQLMLGPH